MKAIMATISTMAEFELGEYARWTMVVAVAMLACKFLLRLEN